MIARRINRSSHSIGKSDTSVTFTNSSRLCRSRFPPRARGRIRHSALGRGIADIPSPRARANLETGPVDFNRADSLPARAGESTSRRRIPQRRQFPPRARGRIGATGAAPTLEEIPSPRARANLRRAGPDREQPDSLPARAGESRSYSRRCHKIRFPPRARGRIRRAEERRKRDEIPSPRARANQPLYLRELAVAALPADRSS